LGAAVWELRAARRKKAGWKPTVQKAKQAGVKPGGTQNAGVVGWQAQHGDSFFCRLRVRRRDQDRREAALQQTSISEERE
jgi:hypothetical protein